MYDDDLNNLEEWMRRLKVEYDIFLNGYRRKPPDDLRFRVEKLVKRLSETNMGHAHRFRYNTLVGRFYVYRDNWRRQMMDREQALEAKNKLQPAETGSRPAPEPSGAPNGFQITIADPTAEDEKVQKLYDWLMLMKNGQQGAPSLSYEQFSKYIAAQTRGIRQKFSCSSVQFRVSVEENAIKFTAQGTKR